MSIFQINEEKGYSRRLSAKGLSSTPWLIHTGSGLKTSELTLSQFILSQRGFMPLNPLDTENMQFRDDFDQIESSLPEWAILTPRLYPAADNLQQSLEYELNLFLDRLDETQLPNAFGLVFDLIHNQDSFLEELLSYQPSILVLRHPNIEDESPRRVLERITRIRQKIPPNIAIYLPGSGGIGYQTLLVALGVDIIDDLAAYRFAARKRAFVDNQIHYLPDREMAALIDINIKALKIDFDNIIFNLDRNTLWSKVDKDMHVLPHVASFRHLLAHDKSYNLTLSLFAKSQENPLKFIGEEGLYHPDVLAFQERVLSRYVEEERVKLLILLPCSARKPYRESYSHQRYEKAIQKGSKEKRTRVNVWSLTSPLGVVPRSIETVYPAQNYDIPVTGNWSHEEAEITGTLLGKMLNKLNPDVKVIVHSSKDYAPMIEVAKKFHNVSISWLDNKSRSDEALQILENMISEELEEVEGVDFKIKGSYIQARDTIRAITRYVHGEKAQLEFDPERIRVIGRPPRPIAIQKDRKHWVTWDKLGGTIRLHQDSAFEIALTSSNWILVSTEELRGSSLFSIGVVDASNDISPGDEVLFFNENKTVILGIGDAVLSGNSMKKVQNGIAAKIRKKFVEELK